MAEAGRAFGRVSALLFDFDGVLVESFDLKAEAFRRLYEPYGDRVADAAVAHYRANAGVPRTSRIAHCHRAFLGHEAGPDEIAELSEQFRLLVEGAVVACPLVSGASDVLDRHRGRIPLFVLSATPQQELERILRRRGMADTFTAIAGSPPDKSARMGNLIATHDIEPFTALMVGDGVADMQAAYAHGVRFLGRVPPGALNPFPPDVPIVEDLTGLDLRERV